MTKPLKLAIAGCGGRMGLTLIQTANDTDGVIVTAGSERADADTGHLQMQLAAYGAANMLITSEPDELVRDVDAVIDFTSPEATLSVAESVAKTGGIHIIGTTGFTAAQQKELNSYGRDMRIVQSGNFSLGVNLLENLIEQAAAILNDSYDIEIFEMHHRHKKDAPSGTALMLGRAAARGRKVDFEEKKVTVRDGITGEREKGSIGFTAQRGGDVVGIHDIFFAGPGEMVTLKHQGFSREIYAHGAIRSALWARNRKPGLYSMKDVLGF